MTTPNGDRRGLALGLVLLVAATFVIVSTREISNTRSRVSNWIDGEAELVQEDVTEAIDAVLADLESVAAFIEGGHPTSSSFSTFVQQIDGTAHAIGIGYTLVVPAQDLDAYVAEQRAVHWSEYEVFGLSETASPVPLDRTGRALFFPVAFFAVGDLVALGVDTFGKAAQNAAGAAKIHHLPGKHFLQEDQAEAIAGFVSDFVAGTA